jgi:2-polyprenyl-3-methyl-5-hydroxy-6-metoxy-1,4-benzoquinol methylase
MWAQKEEKEMLQYHILKHFPGFLRWYRTQLLLDLMKIVKMLPNQGYLLDVGCGIGLLDFEIARLLPDLKIHGIDINEKSVEMARIYHASPKINYDCMPIEAVVGQYDCILFVDVFHHIEPTQYKSLLGASKRLLGPQGYIMVKDVERRMGWVSFFMDKYISGCKDEDIYLQNCNELANVVSNYLELVDSEVKFRFPFPHYYIRAN